MSGKTERSQDFSKADEEARKCFKAFFEPAEGAFKADKKARKRLQGFYSLLFTPYRGMNSNLRSPMLNSLREWGERRSTRVFALKIAQKRLEFDGVCTVTFILHRARLASES